MTEVIGDVVRPSELVIPNNDISGNLPVIAGQIMLSGANLIWYDGSAVRVLSGSNTGD